MAGKELYIEPILEQNLSVVPGLAENIAEMTTQLGETTRILMNVVSNQGIEQHQAAYSGSALSSLTFVNSTISGSDERTSIYINDAGGGTPASVDSCTASQIVFKTWATREGGNAETNINIQFVKRPYIYPLGEKVSVPITATGTTTFSNITAYFYPSGGSQTQVNGTYSNGEFVFDIPEAIQNTACGFWQIYFHMVSTIDNAQFTVCAEKYTHGDSVETAEIVYYKKLGFNSANALTLLSTKDANITCPSSTEYVQTGYLTIPDELSVGQWNVALLNGSGIGTNLIFDLVDDTTHSLIAHLPTGTVDISAVQQMSNLALKITTTPVIGTLTGFALRYF